MNTVGSEYTLSDILGENSIFYIGKANWTASGEYANCWVDNFRIYDGLLDKRKLTFSMQNLQDRCSGMV